MTHTEFSWRARDGQKLYAQEWQPDVPIRGAIALVHGLGEHSGRYAHVAESFNAAGYSVVALDLRGHGKTGGQLGHIPSFEVAMQDIDYLLEQTALLHPGLPLFLYGHSMGGALVLYYALNRRPNLTGIIATSPGLAPATPPTRATLFSARIAYRLMPTMQIDNGLDLSGLSNDPEVIRRYQADPLVHPKISARLGLDIIQNGQWVLQHAAEFPLPLLLMVGSADRLVSVPAVHQMAKSVPPERITFREWPGGYHELHNEPNKAEVIAFILDWIKQKEPSPPASNV
ncbi:MAG: alpha/beta hydrolase [Anaerolinea sp.]|nr:alpha/beta hydrolase [Anaerolinea sp.]